MILDTHARIQTKLQEAKEQGDLWRQHMSTAAEQVARWDAVRQVCEELLTPAPNEKSPDAPGDLDASPDALP